MDIKIYALRSYGWENTTCTLFYNPTKDYSDNEFKLLCSELTCIMIDKKVKESIEFSKKCDLKTILKTNDEVCWYEIYYDVGKELLKYGFKEITANIDFSLCDESILKIKQDEEPSQEEEMVQKCYKQYIRRKKIEKLI